MSNMNANNDALFTLQQYMHIITKFGNCVLPFMYPDMYPEKVYLTTQQINENKKLFVVDGVSKITLTHQGNIIYNINGNNRYKIMYIL